MCKNDKKVTRVILTEAEYAYCKKAAKLEKMPSYSSWARKVLIEASEATRRGLRK